MSKFEELKKYYIELIDSEAREVENLFEPIHDDFLETILKIKKRSKTALDIGYGSGKHTRELSINGYQVDAIDLIPTTIFTRKYGQIARVSLFEGNILEHTLNKTYDFILAKDILHYLPQKDVIGLMKDLCKATNVSGIHYYNIFTDIRRRSRNGDKLTVKDEANFTSKDLCRFIKDYYKGWEIQLDIEEYSEKSFDGTYDYFTANKLSLIAQKLS